MSDKTENPRFIFPWRALALGIMVFIAVRALLWFLEAKFQMGLGPMGQAITAGVFGTLALFVMVRNNNGKA